MEEKVSVLETGIRRLNSAYLLLAFLGILIIGTLGYWVIEGWSLIDSFFMTVITITTVGYREVGGELSTVGKFFTTGIIFSGFGVAALALSHFGSMIIKGELNSALGRMRMQNLIRSMKDHYIIAGFGRTGQVVATHLKAKKIPFVVVDNSLDALARFSESQIPFVNGDASDEDVLQRAGVERAKGFISVVSSDANNAFAIMTARGMNPRLRIVARALDLQSVRKLKNAGAEKVVAPYVLGGMRIAQSITHPHAAEFIDLVEDVQTVHIEMADFKIRPESPLNGSTLSDAKIKELGVIVVGVRRSQGDFVFQPGAATVINANDHLVVIGPAKNIEAMYQKLGTAR